MRLKVIKSWLKVSESWFEWLVSHADTQGSISHADTQGSSAYVLR